MQSTIPLDVDSLGHALSLVGPSDENIKAIEQETGASVVLRGDELSFSGTDEQVEMAHALWLKMAQLLKKREIVDKSRIRYAAALAREGQLDRLEEILSDVITITYRGKPVQCKTLGQRQYAAAMRDKQMVFAVGPAGTGKTYLAMAMASRALKNREVERIILTRPAVEAGEKLGFLPGDLTSKIDPYLRPLYDAMHDLIGPEAYQKLLERGAVEVAPLAYMRGRTLSDAFVVLDEAQNTTSEQMKMFLTRMGFGSRMVITGDVTQVDLPYGKKSGLVEAVEVLSKTPEIAVINLTHKDVVRHELVQAIVKAYEKHDGKQRMQKAVRAGKY
ncbi:MAG: PhoH family protein [Oscillospiraceae bacterium]|jgi:phosphate starvation-inducible PhoH-like protein|nr:PhoH family protein [Oscillospiraceae bacterium]